MIASFRSKALKRFWQKNNAAGLRPDWRKRTQLILSLLDAATAPEELDVPGLAFHALKGNLAGQYAVTVSHKWRVTFGWDGEDATEVDLEDYHG